MRMAQVIGVVGNFLDVPEQYMASIRLDKHFIAPALPTCLLQP